jgi:hypothetical protein
MALMNPRRLPSALYITFGTGAKQHIPGQKAAD